MDAKQTTFQVLSELSGKEPAAITPEMDLVADLGIDSPKALRLLLELEDRLGVEISDEEAAKIDSVADILGFLEASA